ncbi:MAG: tetratricopeptide repeat protein [Chroococcidiopsidaceae cyanobacterium CP_BM_RX_35]|nr:tetratricopeptide repeat protein [Chroococcidiopsidaceae cyanobacterium CP_BM_RX_35]
MRKLLLGTDAKRFNLLSIGQRGVGKTVFLAGSYAELQTGTQGNACGRSDDSRAQAQTITSPRTLRFDCQDAQERKSLDRILNYVAQTGQYPPPTMKATNFNFSLKRHSFLSEQTLCSFRWWEIPGEICRMSNQEFYNIVSSSHGCCVFIDASELVRNKAYLQGIEDIVETVMGLASLVYLNNFKYAFALVLTKCDRIESDLFNKQQIELAQGSRWSYLQRTLEEQLQPLTSYLDGMKINYQLFYSYIPIIRIKGTATLSAAGAANALLWLVSELGKAHKSSWLNTLLDSVTYLRPTDVQLRQELQALENGSLETLFKPWNSHSSKALAIKKTLTARRNGLLSILISVGFLGGSGIFLVNFLPFFQHAPKNFAALRELTILEQRGQFDQAVSLMEKLVQQEPNDIALRLQLAQLYQFTGQVTKAETVYDWVLTMQKNNLNALVGKATMREVQGDIKTAKVLFAQAENVAPKRFKAKVHTIAVMTLRSPTNPLTKP